MTGEAAGEAVGAPLPWLQRRVCVALHTGPHRVPCQAARRPLAERESWPHAAHDTLHGCGGGGGGGGGERERGVATGTARRAALHGADDAELLERNAAR